MPRLDYRMVPSPARPIPHLTQEFPKKVIKIERM